MTLITSPFNDKTPAREVVAGHDLRGLSVIVTGGASGIGVETSRALAEAGADVTIAARNAQQAKDAIADIERTAPGRTKAGILDLGSLASVRDFAKSWGDKPLNVLINNAGVMACPQAYTADNLEMQLGTNHFGHYLLGVLLAPSLKKGAQNSGKPSRLVSVSSIGHRQSDIDFDDPHYRTRPYNPWQAYGQSKTANILFAFGFDERFKDQGIRANALMPGRIITPLMRHMSQDDLVNFGLMGKDGKAAERDDMKNPEQGASTNVWAAIGRELEGRGGLYLEDCNEAPVLKTAVTYGLMARCKNPDTANRLWELSQSTTGA